MPVNGAVFWARLRLLFRHIHARSQNIQRRGMLRHVAPYSLDLSRTAETSEIRMPIAMLVMLVTMTTTMMMITTKMRMLMVMLVLMLVTMMNM